MTAQIDRTRWHLGLYSVSLTRQREQTIPTLLDSWLRRGVLTSSVIRPEKQLHELWGETIAECFTRSALICDEMSVMKKNVPAKAFVNSA